MQYDAVDNDDGISVFDVTVPGHPRYVMIQLAEHENEYGYSNKILNARDYMLRYRKDAPFSDFTAQIQALDDLLQVDVAALESAWPQSDFQPRLSTSLQENITYAGLQVNTLNTLTESSMRSVIEKGLQGDIPEVEWFAEAEQVSGFTKSLSVYLHSRPQIVHGTRASLILGIVLKDYDTIDLSSFELWNLRTSWQ
jgi:hypothetical protein